MELARLELKYCNLEVESALAAIGQNEELKTHLRGPLNLEWTADSCVRHCSR